MKLTELQAEFVRWERRPDGTVVLPHVDGIEGAMGVLFLCPACFRANGGPRGTHSVICWSRSSGTPDLATPGPGRWRMDGTGLQDLSLNAEEPGGARSVQLFSRCGWHGFVTDGGAE